MTVAVPWPLRRTLGMILGLVGLCCWAAAPAHAAWGSSATGSAQAQSSTLAPPPTLVATCLSTLSSRVVLNWTASGTTWKDGYEISRVTISGTYNAIDTVAAGVLTYTTVGSLAIGTYYFMVKTTGGSWHSVGSPQASRSVVALLCV